MYRKVVSAGTVVALALVTVGCGSSAPTKTTASAASKAPYKIAFVSSLEGAASVDGIPGVAGGRAAINYINSTGGVNGHKIQLTVYNDQSSATQAPAAAQQAISGHPVAILDSTASTYFSLRVPVYAGAKIPVTSDTSSDVAYPWMYNAFPTAYQEGSTFITMAESALNVKNLDGKRLAYVAADTTGDHAQYPVIQQLVSQAGGKIVDTEFQPLGSPTFNGAPNVVAAHPDVVLIGDSDPDGIVEASTLKSDGYKGPIASNYGASATTTLQSINSPQYSAQWLAPEVLPKTSIAYRWAVKDHAVADVSNTRYSMFWSAGLLYAQALKKCGYPCSPAKLETALSKIGRINIPGGTAWSPFGSAGTDHVLLSSYELWSYKNGKFVAASAKPIPLTTPHYSSN
jgi:branched-chain amino acid transport system substrate-binding protein